MDNTTDQNERIARLESRIAELETKLEERTGEDGDERQSPVSRRSLLKAAGVTGLLGLGVGQVAGDPQGQLGTSTDPVRSVHTETLAGGVTGNEPIQSLAGAGLWVDDGSLSVDGAETPSVSISRSGELLVPSVSDIRFSNNIRVYDEGDGSVRVEAVDTDTDTDTHTAVSDDGAAVVDDVDDIDFGANLAVTDHGDDTATVDADAGTIDTRTNVSEGGQTVVSDVEDIAFRENLVVSDDSDDSVTVDLDRASLAGDGLTTVGTALTAALGNGLEFDSGQTRVDPAGIAGNGLKETGSSTLGVEPADFAGNSLRDEGSDTLEVEQGAISHDAIADVDSGDHHTRPGAGTGLDETSNQFNLANPQFREPTTKDLTSVGFGTWRGIDPDRPAFLEVEVSLNANNDGSKEDGQVTLQIDEDGDGFEDVTYTFDFDGSSVNDGESAAEYRFRSVYVPPGGQFQLNDLFAGGTIQNVRAIVG